MIICIHFSQIWYDETFKGLQNVVDAQNIPTQNIFD